MLKPAEILESIMDVAIVKANGKFLKLLIWGMLAGVFIAFAGQASVTAAYNLLAKPETYGLGRVLAGIIFPAGLMLVLLTKAELFTGNTMMIAAVCEKKITCGGMFRNWGIVYLGNLLGSLLIAVMVAHSGLLENFSGGLFGAVTLKLAVSKVNLTFLNALLLGILCNWLVCLAVWNSYGTESISGKILSALFPIWLFVTSGFEHSIANMFSIPVAILVKGNTALVEIAGLSGSAALQKLTWGGFFLNNLLPVTLGNIIGGSLFVAMAYWFTLKKVK